jgi:hypothetical protein
MCKLTTKNIVWIAAAIISFANPIQAISQFNQDDTYVNRNQIEVRPLKLSRITGIAKDEEGAVIVGVRLLLFSDPGHKLIASTVTDQDGVYAFGHIARGRYRLVAKSLAFCPANVAIQVRYFGKKQLHLHMVVGDLDTCSFGDLK